MKGIVFNLLEDVVTRAHGAETWDDLLDEANVSGAYTSLGSYLDNDMVALVGAASAKLGIPPGDVLRWFGQQAMPILAQHYPKFFTGHKSARNFIISVNNIIHPEVHKLYPGASCPFFHFREGEAGALVMDYQSARKLCDLAHGFVLGAAEYYSEQVDVTHHSCMHHGDDKCSMEIKWPN